MTTAPTRPTPPPPARSAPPPAAVVTNSRRMLRPRDIKKITPLLVLNAVEGHSKTTLAAYAPDPFILMAPGETGYDTLLGAGRVPQVPAESVTDWLDALAWIDQLIADPQGRKTLALDAMGGFERMCHDYTCKKDFGNDWSEKGFMSYHKGYDVSARNWIVMLSKLEQLRDRHGIVVLMLGHVKIATFKNPLGADFDRYTSDIHQKIWDPTRKWADAVFFGNFRTTVETARGANAITGKGKGIGGTDRVLYTERRDAWDAKNRYGMPPEIEMGDDPAAMWEILWGHITGGK